MKVYWYAPFDNAGELALAAEIAKDDCINLSVQSISERFGTKLAPGPTGDFALLRDLPPPAVERRPRNNPLDRAGTAVERSAKRRSYVRRGGFDLLHLHTFNPVTDWTAIRRLRRFTPTIIQSVHNVRPHDSPFPKRLETALLRRGYAACTALVVAHPELRELLVEDMQVPRKRIRVIPLPVTMPVRAEKSQVRSGSSEVHFLFFGTLRKNKGVSVLIEALRILAAAGPLACGLRFTIAGRGDRELEEVVKAAASELQSLNVEIGYISGERRQQLYDAADCVLLPYTSISAQSGVLHDAYSQALPVIVSDVGPVGRTVEGDGSGWVTPPNDPSALAQAIISVAGLPDDRQRYGEHARMIALERSPSAIAQQLLELYQDCSAATYRSSQTRDDLQR